MPPQTPVGLIGVGLMGEVYARRLIAAGFGVIGFDIDPARNERIVQIGGRTGTNTDIARQCDPIIVALFSTDQVEDVIEHALLPAAAGKIVICTSTCDPNRIAALGARVAQEIRFLEVPVSGTSAQVRQGDGVGLIGGDVATAQIGAPVLEPCSPGAFTSERSAMAAAPSSRSTLFSDLIVLLSPRGSFSPRGLVSIRRRFSKWPASPQPRRKSWIPRDRRWWGAILLRRVVSGRRSKTRI